MIKLKKVWKGMTSSPVNGTMLAQCRNRGIVMLHRLSRERFTLLEGGWGNDIVVAFHYFRHIVDLFEKTFKRDKFEIYQPVVFPSTTKLLLQSLSAWCYFVFT